MRTLLLTITLGFLFLTIGYAQTPTFTGNAAADFLGVPGHQFFIDFADDVGLPNAAPSGTVSGWDIRTAFFFYDDIADDLYVGIDFGSVFSDAEGNRNPSTSSPWLSVLGGVDHPNMGGREGFILAFDNGDDGDYDIHIGVSQMGNISEFGLYEFTSDINVAPSQFPVAATGSIALYSDVFNMDTPDLEFIIENASDYMGSPCGIDFSIFAGGFEDGPVGEDEFNARLNLCSPLPVTFTDFNSDAKGRRVQLDWNLASETNNDYFEIQHATDANGAFKTVGRIEGGGTTTVPTAYTFYHQTPVKGNNYYRIKQVDFDGIVGYSWVVTQQYEGGDDSTIDIYPNPNKGEFMIGLPRIAIDTQMFIQIVDATGKTVMEENSSLQAGLTAYPMNIEGLPEGYYYALLTSQAGNTYHKGFFIH